MVWTFHTCCPAGRHKVSCTDGKLAYDYLDSLKKTLEATLADSKAILRMYATDEVTSRIVKTLLTPSEHDKCHFTHSAANLLSADKGLTAASERMRVDLEAMKKEAELWDVENAKGLIWGNPTYMR
jgi:hypothetical protein